MRADRLRAALAAGLVVGLLAGGAAGAAEPVRHLPAPAVAYGLAHGLGHLSRTVPGQPLHTYPDRTDASGQWLSTPATAWTSGYYPGLLWSAYQATGDPAWRTRAERASVRLLPVQHLTTTHDLGLMLGPAFGADLRLTGDPQARTVLLTAADTLARRYSPVVGAIKSYDVPSDPDAFPVIVDNLMNLELLLWAAAHGGDRRHAEIALQHALTTLRDAVEPDGSTWQNVRYDPGTGEVVRRTDRSWARGQAWAVHGFTAVHAATGDARMLSAARRVSEHLLDRLPADGVPTFHLDRPDEPRDSSAAAIAADGLLHLALVDPDPVQRARWRAGGERLLAALVGPEYAADVATSEAAVLHATYALLPRATDLGLIWADHYRLSALLRTRQLPVRGQRLPVRSPARAAVDGVRATTWAARAGAAPLVLDLGAVRRAGALRVDWRASSSVGFVVQASADGSRWHEVARGRSAGDDRRPEAYDLGAAAARYLRLVVRDAPAGAAVREVSVSAPERLTGADTVAALGTPGTPVPRGGTVTSRVVDGLGRPVADARVELWTRGPGHADWARAAVRTSGADGRTRWPVARTAASLQVRVPAAPGRSPAVSAAVDVSAARDALPARRSALRVPGGAASRH